MIFTRTRLSGVYIIDTEQRVDERGSFARIFCTSEFAAHGLTTHIAQINMSVSRRRGTLRGLHRQVEPHVETKLVWCARGAVFDVCVDMRPESPTYRQWLGQELTESNHRMLYIPERCAHGFVTLTDDTHVSYIASTSYAPGAVRGVRYDDPSVAIEWPIAPSVISEQDQHWPLLDEFSVAL